MRYSVAMTKPTDNKTPVTEHAYKNLDFLTSKDARPLRILSEYLYPKLQLEEQKVKDTIVILDPQEHHLLRTWVEKKDLVKILN